jgi:hypothetical protein
MLQCHERPSGRKEIPNRDADDGVFDAAHLIARRFGLSDGHARVVAELAGLGGDDGRTSASGGRAK